MGIATTNPVERTLASFGFIKGVQPKFDNHNSVPNGGVLFLLPALLSQGLMKIKETHKIEEGYYSLESIVLTLAFMALCRIKNPQQLTQCAPGEMGKLLGLDRVPEIKCLRAKMAALFANNKTQELNNQLAAKWIETTEEHLFLYTDGHVKIYNGSLANPTKKFISRQKLCLPATADFWLNDAQGLPIMVWTGDLSEKLQQMIEKQMIPRLFESGILKKDDASVEPVCTLIFDREAYEPKFFERLWLSYRIAVITYRKNVKDTWKEDDFTEYEIVDNLKNKKTMLLAEKKIELNGVQMREIRKQNTRNHQTAIITTHATLNIVTIAVAMFNRWLQENYFKYMLADYSLDHIHQYGVEEIDLNLQIPNPEYKMISYQLKKEREKLQRARAQLLKKVKLDSEEMIDQFAKSIESKATLVIEVDTKTKLIEQLLTQRKKLQPKVKLSELPVDKQYTKLKTESAYFMSTLKMICYRAETSTANLLDGHYSKFIEEKRMFIKNIISTPVDLIVSHEDKTLTVKLYSLNTPKANEIARYLCSTLNDTETIYPGTNLKLIFKSVVG